MSGAAPGSLGASDDCFINEYGVSVTTLEEVFIRVGHEQAVDADDRDKDQQAVRDVASKLDHTRTVLKVRVLA